MRRLNQTAFTMVETIIVLAIASVIFSIIFVSLPILIRNSHNNQRKQDVSAVLSAISQYQLSHSGINFPTTSAICNAACVSNLLQYTKLSFYEKSDINIHIETPGGGAVTTVASDEVHVYNYHLCNGDNTSAISDGAGYRDIALLYNIESSNSLSVKCLQL